MNASHSEVNGGGRHDTVAARPARRRRWRRLGVAIRTPQPKDPWPWRVSRHGGARGTCSHLRRGSGGLRWWWALAALQPDSTVCSPVARMFRPSGSSCAAGTCAPPAPGRRSNGGGHHDHANKAAAVPHQPPAHVGMGPHYGWGPLHPLPQVPQGEGRPPGMVRRDGRLTTGTAPRLRPLRMPHLTVCGSSGRPCRLLR